MPVKTQLTTGTATPASTTGGPATAPAVAQTGGNAAAQDKLKKVSGPIGRVWNHILGQPDGSTNTGAASVDQAMVRAYLDKRLGLAEGEMFRGKKLDGVAEKLVTQFDKDGDGRVNWTEFQEFEGQIFAMLAPGAEKPGANTGALAGAQFGKVDGAGDQSADLDEIQSANKASLPRGTEYADLVAQLGARVTIDAADKDEAGKPIGDRTLSREEWTGAAAETANRRK
ncbi:MAG: EF-hand domain-containing protein [Pseudomonadota bacterium]|nr:EF-hand domain-containing protein [Pseudomonadota bacterium]